MKYVNTLPGASSFAFSINSAKQFYFFRREPLRQRSVVSPPWVGCRVFPRPHPFLFISNKQALRVFWEKQHVKSQKCPFLFVDFFGLSPHISQMQNAESVRNIVSFSVPSHFYPPTLSYSTLFFPPTMDKEKSSLSGGERDAPFDSGSKMSPQTKTSGPLKPANLQRSLWGFLFDHRLGGRVYGGYPTQSWV